MEERFPFAGQLNVEVKIASTYKCVQLPICIRRTFSADRQITISPILMRIALELFSFYLLICRFGLNFHRAFFISRPLHLTPASVYSNYVGQFFAAAPNTR